MKVTVLRAIPLVLVLDVALFATSGIGRLENAKHGVDSWVGDLVWLGFLAGALTLVVLLAVAARRFVVSRRATAAGAR